VIVGPILEGMAKAGRSQDLADFDLAPYVRISVGDDVARCRDALRPGLALYIGGMGARGRNFYNDLAKRLGYEAAAVAIQDHFLAGRRDEAAAAVPDALIDEISLVGPPATASRTGCRPGRTLAEGQLGRLAGAGRRRRRGDARGGGVFSVEHNIYREVFRGIFYCIF
jgi:hypothetical protein